MSASESSEGLDSLRSAGQNARHGPVGTKPDTQCGVLRVHVQERQACQRRRPGYEPRCACRECVKHGLVGLSLSLDGGSASWPGSRTRCGAGQHLGLQACGLFSGLAVTNVCIHSSTRCRQPARPCRRSRRRPRFAVLTGRRGQHRWAWFNDARVESTYTTVPSAISVTPLAATIAGRPRPRARIAVCAWGHRQR